MSVLATEQEIRADERAKVIEACVQEFEDALRGIGNIQRDHINYAIAHVRSLKQTV